MASAPVPLARSGPSVPVSGPVARGVPADRVPGEAAPRLVAVEWSLATTGLATLEAIDRRLAIPALRECFEHRLAVQELLPLRTCHRFELYCWTADPETALAALAELGGRPTAARVHRGLDAVVHLFQVTAGLESTAVGEREVRDQVRAASRRGWSRAPRAVLRPLFERAVAAAGSVAPSVPPSRSIAALAAARALAEAPVPFPRVLVVGTGVVGRAVAEQLASYGRVTLVYRSRPPEAEFLRATDARAVPWDGLGAEIALADVLVTAVKTAGRIIGPAEVEGRRRPLVAIDLGMPRNVDPSLELRPGVRRIDLERLRDRLPATPPPNATDQVASLAREAALDLVRAGHEAWIDTFRRASEQLRRQLLAEPDPTLGTLSESQRAAVDRLTRKLTTRLLEAPTEELRALPPGPEGDERRRWAAELLRLPRPRS